MDELVDRFIFWSCVQSARVYLAMASKHVRWATPAQRQAMLNTRAVIKTLSVASRPNGASDAREGELG